MRSVNKVILIGNLTRDPELKTTPNGQAVVTFGLATNREWITKETEKKNSTEFHELVAWARLAEICHKHLKKGKLIYVEGYLKTRSWDTPEGVRKFKTEIVVQDMIMLEKRPKETEDEVLLPEVENETPNEEDFDMIHEEEKNIDAPAGKEKSSKKEAEKDEKAPSIEDDLGL